MASLSHLLREAPHWLTGKSAVTPTCVSDRQGHEDLFSVHFWAFTTFECFYYLCTCLIIISYSFLTSFTHVSIIGAPVVWEL